jgi:putative tryptophan/tyrosine transport system substrate-binding protein
MKNKIITLALSALLFPVSFPVQAQQPVKVFRIGIATGRMDANNPGPQVEAFGQGLRALGYIEGKNILMEYRFLEGNPDVYSKLVVELVSLKVDVLVLFGALPAIRAAKQATKTIPIVIVTTQDPVATGIIDSLARPGGNITGVTTLQRELSGKRLELLKDAVPGILRVAALVNETQLGKGPDTANDFQWYEAPARALKISLQPLALRGPNPDFEGAFQAAAKGRTSALITVAGSLLNPYQKQIADLAIKNRLPSMHERSDYVEAGGLMSYSANDAESSRRAAVYVDRILKGAKPADLPVEQPMKFDFVINQKTAKQIGLTIPPDLLARATKIIR